MIKAKHKFLTLRANNTQNLKQIIKQRPVAQRKCQSVASQRQQSFSQMKIIYLNKINKQNVIDDPHPHSYYQKASSKLSIRKEDAKTQRGQSVEVKKKLINPLQCSSINQKSNHQSKSQSFKDDLRSNPFPLKLFTLSLVNEQQDTLGLLKNRHIYMKKSDGKKQKVDPYLYFHKMKNKLKNHYRYQYHSNLIITVNESSTLKTRRSKEKNASTINIDNSSPIYRYRPKPFSQRKKQSQPRPWSTCKSERND